MLVRELELPSSPLAGGIQGGTAMTQIKVDIEAFEVEWLYHVLQDYQEGFENNLERVDNVNSVYGRIRDAFLATQGSMPVAGKTLTGHDVQCDIDLASLDSATVSLGTHPVAEVKLNGNGTVDVIPLTDSSCDRVQTWVRWK